MSEVIVDTAPNGAIQLLKEECWKLNILHLKDETCQATELTERYGHMEEKSPKTKCPASVAGAADIDNNNEEDSEESPNNNVVDVQAEPLALVSVEKEAAGDGKVLRKVVKPKGWLKEGSKDQLTPTIYDMITDLPKSYFGSTESLPEMCSRGPEVSSRGPEVRSRGPRVCSRGPKVCSGVPEVSNAVEEVSSDTKTTEAAEDLLDTGNVLRKVVQLSIESHPEVCNGEAEVSSGVPGGCSGVPGVSSAVDEVSSDTKTTEAVEDLLDTGNVLSKVVNPKGGLKQGWEDQLTRDFNDMIAKLPKSYFGSNESLPEVCSGVPGVCSGVPGVSSGVPEVCSGVPVVSNAVDELSSDTKTTEAAEDLLDTGNVLSKVVNPKGWLKQGWEDQLTRDFNDMIAKLPKSYFASNESLPEVCSGVPEVSNAVEEVSSDTKKQKKNGVLRFFRRVWKFFTCTNSLPKEE